MSLENKKNLDNPETPIKPELSKILKKKGLGILLSALIMFNQVGTSLAQDHNPDEVSLELRNRPTTTQSIHNSAEETESAEQPESIEFQKEFEVFPGVTAKTHGLSVEISIDETRLNPNYTVNLSINDLLLKNPEITIQDNTISSDKEGKTIAIHDNTLFYKLDPRKLLKNEETDQLYIEITGTVNNELLFKSPQLIQKPDLYIEQNGITLATENTDQYNESLVNSSVENILRICEETNQKILNLQPDNYDNYQIKSVSLHQPLPHDFKLKPTGFYVTNGAIATNSENILVPDLLNDIIQHEANHAMYYALSEKSKERLDNQHKIIKNIFMEEVELYIEELKQNEDLSYKDFFNNCVWSIFTESTYLSTLTGKHKFIMAHGHPEDNANELYASALNIVINHFQELKYQVKNFQCSPSQKKEIITTINTVAEIGGLDNKLDPSELITSPEN